MDTCCRFGPDDRLVWVVVWGLSFTRKNKYVKLDMMGLVHRYNDIT